MSPGNSLSQLFTGIFNSLKKEEFISLFEDTEGMINYLREQFKLFIESTKKLDRLLMIDDLIKVDNVINRAEILVSTVIRDLQDTEDDDISRRKVHFRKQIDEIAKTDICSLKQRRERIHKNTKTHRTSDTRKNTGSKGKRNRVNKKPSNLQNKSSFREVISTLFHRIVSVFVN